MNWLLIAFALMFIYGLIRSFIEYFIERKKENKKNIWRLINDSNKNYNLVKCFYSRFFILGYWIAKGLSTSGIGG